MGSDLFPVLISATYITVSVSIPDEVAPCQYQMVCNNQGEYDGSRYAPTHAIPPNGHHFAERDRCETITVGPHYSPTKHYVMGVVTAAALHVLLGGLCALGAGFAATYVRALIIRYTYNNYV